MGLAWSNAEIEGASAAVEIQETGPDITSNEISEKKDQQLEELTDEEAKQKRQEELEKFKQDLAVKRDLRKQKLNQVSDELSTLREQLENEKIKRLDLEEQLRQFKNGHQDEVLINESRTDDESMKYHSDNDPNDRITDKIESLRISKYDDDDEIDIIDESDGNDDKQTAVTSSQLLEIDGQIQEQQTTNKKKKGVKKRVSFSLELVKESDEEPERRLMNNDDANETTENSDERKIPDTTHDNLTNTDETVVDKSEECHEDDDGDDSSEKKENEIKEDDDDDDDDDEVKKLSDKNEKLMNQIKALKDVVTLHKQLLGIRESQVNELNKKIAMVDLKEQDYERKMKAMKELRRLYEERGRAMLVEHQQQLQTERARVNILESKLRFSVDNNEDLAERNKHLEEKVKNLDNTLDQIRSELSETKIKLATEKESLYHASSQISLINNLVSQIVSGPELDLDHLARFLEDNHSLINELTTKGDINYVASALVGVAGGIVEVPKEEKSDIAENLGKVWRVLVELLSHHKKSEVNANGNGNAGGNNQEWDSCYKSVDTPKGPKLVISVSQTFIKLKDLILEKNSLVKEVGRLRKLNGHLELRMGEQENRLTLVTEELHNTWDVVNKLKRQHDNLHTHERILKHELQHKRSIVNGLKKQLEICREQWALAREKNSKTENDWMLLRAEFAMRKQKKKFFNSAESGYEEEETQSPEYDTEDDDKSLEIEEESPENSVGDNVPPTGNTTPSEISNSEISDDGNGPISEILDSIFEEAIKIANNTKNDTSLTSTTMASTKEIKSNPDDRTLQIDIENDQSDPNQDAMTVQKDKNGIQNDRNYNSYSYCDTIRKFSLEQIPEVEENWANTDEVDNFCSLSSILEDNETGKNQISNFDHNCLKDNDLGFRNEENRSNLNQFSTDRTRDSSEGSDNERLVNKDEKMDGNDRHDEVQTISNQEETTETAVATKSETGSLKMDEILRRRDERFRRMEESCKSLFVQMGQTSDRSNAISNKLDQIHAAFVPQQQTIIGDKYCSDLNLNFDDSTDENQLELTNQIPSDLNDQNPMTSTNIASHLIATSPTSNLSLNLTSKITTDSTNQADFTTDHSLNLTDPLSTVKLDSVKDQTSNLTNALKMDLTSTTTVKSDEVLLSNLTEETTDLTSSPIQTDVQTELSSNLTEEKHNTDLT